jgi:hypothetical protein
LKKNPFVWNDKDTLEFSLLKDDMDFTLVLAAPDFGKTFIVECDALGLGIGAILRQEGRPLDFQSKQFKRKYLVKSTYEKEMEAILHEIKKWQQYLIGRHFKVKIDHDSLKYFWRKHCH